VDNLVLTRVAREASAELTGSILVEFGQQSRERFRLVFDTPEGRRAFIVSMNPERPWLGRDLRRWRGPRWSPDPFTVAAGKALEGRRVVAVTKDGSDRTLRFDLGAEAGLVLELATHGANLVVLGGGRSVREALRHARRGGGWSAIGEPWSPRPLPPRLLDPFVSSAEAIDRFLAGRAGAGEPALEALRRGLFGIGSIGAQLVIDESAATGESLGRVLRRRLDELRDGAGECAVEAPSDPESARLLPWRPRKPVAGVERVTGEGAAGTAALYYEAVEQAQRLRTRIAALSSILRGEIARTLGAAGKVGREIEGFEDPERHRRMGEALLAGLASARRGDGRIAVPDPAEPSGEAVVIPDEPGRSLTDIADGLFERRRRARRGRRLAGGRLALLSARAARLQEILDRHAPASSEADAAALESAMRDAGLPVALGAATRGARAAASTAPPRLAGVRVHTSLDGWTILVGRTSRDNDRLTFKLASPEDVWLHAADVPGAHVVIRTPDRRSEVPRGTLVEAASLAAWFSDARDDPAVDVRWTSRKHVRRAKGGSSGVVQLKRFQTIRVRPKPPRDAG